ncbi:MAG: mercuric transporter MerT family protein [Candidatus Paceibacteria bacterium]
MKVKPLSTIAQFAGTIVSAILASICCIGPLILAGLGIGSVGIFSSLERYRLIFTLVTFAFLGAAFYLTYRKKRTTDACCDINTIKKVLIKKIALWVITAVAVGLLLFPYVYEAFNRLPATVSLSEYQKRAVIRVEGMTCETCAQSIRSALSNVQGVMAINVDLEKKEVVVGFDSGINDIPVTQLLTAIESTGYKPSIVAE